MNLPAKDTNNTTSGCDDKADQLKIPYNRPRLPAIRYRLGTHATLLERMLSRLRNQTIGGKGGKVVRPLSALTVRNPDDPSIAVFDVWAMVLDVLTFYQERIANEAYLRTVTERRSALELARTIGYELNPGVAASTYLSFTADTSPEAPETVVIPVGIKVQSVPGEDELPQTFETVEEITARPEWNLLKLHSTIADIPEEIGLGTTSLRLEGTDTGLKEGDAVLLVGKDREEISGSERWDVRYILDVNPEPNKDFTKINWERGLGNLNPLMKPADTPKLFAFRKKAALFGYNSPQWEDLSPEDKAKEVGIDYGKATAVALTPDGKTAVTGYADSSIKVWNLDTGTSEETLEGHAKKINCIAISPDGNIVASGDDDGKIVFQNIDGTSKSDPPLESHNGAVNAIEFVWSATDSGNKVISGGKDGKIVVWIKDEGAEWKEDNSKKKAHTGQVTSISCSSDSSYFASAGSEDKLVKIWDCTNFSKESSPAYTSTLSHSLAVTSVSYFSNGTTHKVISGSQDKTIRMWESSTADNVLKETKESPFRGHVLGVTDVKFLPGGKNFVSAGADKNLIVWKEETVKGKVLISTSTLTGHKSVINQIAVSEDGLLCLSGSDDKSAKVWDIANASEIHSLQTLDQIPEPDEWSYKLDKSKYLFLDSKYPEISKGSWVALSKPSYSELYLVTRNTVKPYKKNSLSDKVTRLTVDTDEHMHYFRLQDTDVLIQSEELKIFTDKVEEFKPVCNDNLELESFLTGLEPGRTLLLSGKRMRVTVNINPLPAGINDTGKYLVSANGIWKNILMPGDSLIVLSPPTKDDNGNKIWNLEDRHGLRGFVTEEVDGSVRFQEQPSNNSDDTICETANILSVDNRGRRTSLSLKEKISNYYDFRTFSICANVALATHGETTVEIIGSGDGSTPHQSFEIKNLPLTFVSAATPAGGATTMNIHINGVLWDNAESLLGLSPNDQKYIVRINDDGSTNISFGNGKCGSRLPSGEENIIATYRTGIGLDGEVDSNSLTLLQTKPLGVKKVTNSLPGTGGAAPEKMEDARANAPRSVLTLGRIVSLLDFENFAGKFSGIGKAQAMSLWSGESRIVHLTVAGINGREVSSDSNLYINLLKGINSVREPIQRVLIDNCNALYYNLEARILIDKKYIEENVVKNAEAALKKTGAFNNRSFGEAVTTSEIITVIQDVPGIVAVDLDYLYIEGSSVEFNSSLPASKARTVGTNIFPAELLLLKEDGVTLNVMMR
jgi:WD40 repeat protein